MTPGLWPYREADEDDAEVRCRATRHVQRLPTSAAV